MIIGEIRRYLRDNNSIRVSRSLRDIAYKALSAKEKLSVLHNREPLLSEIASEIGISDKQILEQYGKDIYATINSFAKKS